MGKCMAMSRQASGMMLAAMDGKVTYVKRRKVMRFHFSKILLHSIHKPN